MTSYFISFCPRLGKGQEEEEVLGTGKAEEGERKILMLAGVLPPFIIGFRFSIKIFRSDQSDDWRRGPPPPQREGYQVENLRWSLHLSYFFHPGPRLV